MIRRVVQKTALAVKRALVYFFFDEDAFRFKGIMWFAFQLLGLLGILISTQFLSRPVIVKVSNVEPIGCLDIAQFEEHFSLAGEQYSEKLKKAVHDFILQQQHGISILHGWKVGEQATTMPASDAVPHQILCWYDTPRSAQRIAEVKAMQAKAIGGSQGIGAYSAQAQINHARRLALGTESVPDFSRQREFSASAALYDLTTRSSSTQQLTLHVMMKPTNTRSAYAKPEAWTDAVVIREIPSFAALVEAVDRSGAEGLELAWGLENIADAKWFINWIEIVNTSQSANSEKTTVSLDHTARGIIEFLGGNLEFQQREQRFYAQVGKLLPGEHLWAVFRSRRVIDLSEIETLSDPTVFLDRRYVRGFLIFAGMVSICWLLGNLWGHSGRHRDDLDYACE